MSRRWIWELIQNASDCASKEDLSISIDTDATSMRFSHDGKPFDYKSLLNLITQISSKQNSDDEKTGKFGTGFISTHLISEKVEISGHFQNSTENLEWVEFEIDRSAMAYEGMRQNVISSLETLKTLEMGNSKSKLYEDKSITTFTYRFNEQDDNVLQAIEAGLNDLDKTIPFVLAFVGVIGEVSCNEINYRKTKETKLTDEISVITVKKYNQDLNHEESIFVVMSSNDTVSIASYITKVNEQIEVVRFDDDMPKLFCHFPLIGTEAFSFPVIVNCSSFKIAQERDRIQEGAIENKIIIDEAVRLYDVLMKYTCESKWDNLYNLCYLKSSGLTELQKDINNRISSIYLKMPIVNIRKAGEDIGRGKLFNSENEKTILIPYIEDLDRSDRFWELFNKIEKTTIPDKSSSRKWVQVSSKSKLSLETVYTKLMKNRDIEKLLSFLINEDDLIEWLNEFYLLWLEEDGQRSFITEAIVPNQRNQFIDLSKVVYDDNIDNNLKEILLILGTDIRTKLIYKGINLSSDIKINSYANADVANKIIDKVRDELAKENKGLKRTQETQNAFNKLTDWFMKNPEISLELFEDIYENHFLLSSKEETMRRLSLADKVEETFGNDIEAEELEYFLSETSKILRSIEEGEEPSLKTLLKLFEHISSNSIYSKERFDNLITDSLEEVHKYLNDNDFYDVDKTLEDWKFNAPSETVLIALKDEKEIRIVVRPSDDNKIIFYEEKEVEAVDGTDYELWTYSKG